MRLIDADALVLGLQINQDICFGCPEPEWLGEMIQMLESAPTVENAISRAELFNRLAVLKSPAEANEYKAEVYRVINEL